MYLCIDIGNTNIVIGCFNDDNEKVCDFRLSTKRNATIDEQAMVFVELLRFNGVESSKVDGAIISSVVPEIESNLKV